MFFSKKISSGLFCALLLSYTSANAHDVKMYSDEAEAPSAKEMGNILFSSPPEGSTAPKMRSISFGKKSQNSAAAATLSEPAVAELQDAVIGLPIEFAYNSSEILGKSKSFLNEVGQMLKLPMFASEKLLIEGHTDSAGTKTYNQHLSEQRAKSVKQYLMNNFNVASSRMMTKGKGESEPLTGSNPNAAVNRRVQFRKAL